MYAEAAPDCSFFSGVIPIRVGQDTESGVAGGIGKPPEVCRKKPGRARALCGTMCLVFAQRFENWKRARAPGWPYFLRSTFRASRVR